MAQEGELAPLIVGGAPDAHHDAVVALAALPVEYGERPQAMCTATLIAPRVALTAAHCVAHVDADGVEVVLGGDVSAPDARHIRITEIVRHPKWDSPSHDLALVQLGDDAGITPIALIDAPGAASLQGQAVTLVGYGRDDRGQGGVRHAGTARVVETLEKHIRIRREPALSCAGDSGGPALAIADGHAQVAGVASYGDPSCAEFATYARLDIELAEFVLPVLAQLQSAHAPPSAGCASTPHVPAASIGLALTIPLALLCRRFTRAVSTYETTRARQRASRRRR
ncbi:trypsin-like serine protease [Pendulispora brunnea]|uniref:Trypsin-like serine protease n=1 Tax=Pendulispora brunnea TaxID=2905690 RepID=A0ABZ2KNI6_9BACT